ncbi:MAG TPA: hypothetical protein VGC13_19070 [Longimicrobium sp.]|jgi:hypothetical protein|uniref:hypothetical protein n=1 Tax=Longimicrobium sp. TaxID=2029185 RepID=UPI002EDB7019
MKEIPTQPAAGARLKRSRDGSFVCGPLRVQPRSRMLSTRTPVPHLPPDERERREHVRRWARMMIVHLERADFDTRQEGYPATLARLRDLLDREIERVSVAGG